MYLKKQPVCNILLSYINYLASTGPPDSSGGRLETLKVLFELAQASGVALEPETCNPFTSCATGILLLIIKTIAITNQ